MTSNLPTNPEINPLKITRSEHVDLDQIANRSVVFISDALSPPKDLLPSSRMIVRESAEYQRFLNAAKLPELTTFYIEKLREDVIDQIVKAISDCRAISTDRSLGALCVATGQFEAGEIVATAAEILKRAGDDLWVTNTVSSAGYEYVFFKLTNAAPTNDSLFSATRLLSYIRSLRQDNKALRENITSLMDELEFSRAQNANSESVLLLEKINTILRGAVSRERELKGQISMYRKIAHERGPNSGWMEFAIDFNKVLKMTPRQIVASFPRMLRTVYNVFMVQWERLFYDQKARRDRAAARISETKDATKDLNENAFLFLPINGAGLGHLTRCMAVARSLRLQKPDAEIIFLTTSAALPLIHQMNFTGYNIPSYSTVEGRLTLTEWNTYFYSQLVSVINLHGCKNVVFDGTLPYAGVKDFLKHHPTISATWIRRGLYKNESVREKVKAAEEYFAKVIAPGELNEVPEESALSKITQSVPPILMLPDVETSLSRENACRTLGLDPNKKNIYIQMGAGNINQIQHLQSTIFATLSEIENTSIIVAESIIKEADSAFEGKFRTLKDYPNTRFYEAFDLCVSAAGYNSVYESVALGLKTIFIPNESTGSDDQTARARMTETLDVGAVYQGPFERDRFLSLAKKMLSEPRPPRRYDLFKGAAAAAKILTER